MSTGLRDADLKPYQTHILFSSPKSLGAKRVGSLFDVLKELLDWNIEDPQQHASLTDHRKPRTYGSTHIGWLTYRRRYPVTWATGANAPWNEEHHWLGLIAHEAMVSLVVTEGAMSSRLHRAASSNLAWKHLRKVSAERLETALIRGKSKTLWLSGIHRSVSTKADSKVLIGRDVEASLDALGDQSYHYTATRCEGPADTFTNSSIGVTPRQSKVWLGPSSDWEAFTGNSESLLELIDATTSVAAPYPLLARPGNSLVGVSEAFDIGLERADWEITSNDSEGVKLQGLLQEATWYVTGSASPECAIDFTTPSGTHKIAIDLAVGGEDVELKATQIASTNDEEAKLLMQLLARRDLTKIYYESAHTFSDGSIFRCALRDIEFDLTPADFTAFDVSKEKPQIVGADGKKKLDLEKIGDPSDDSLFTWIQRRYPKGWLWCDDGSREMADFLHLTPAVGSAKRTLSFIHAKGANSKLDTRGISVTAYEVVCAQALKNLRFLERKDLAATLRHKIPLDKVGRCWKDGKRLPTSSSSFLNALDSVKYSELEHRVIVVQPHVRKSILKKPTPNIVRQAGLLYTLLNGIEADVKRMGARFEVLVDR